MTDDPGIAMNCPLCGARLQYLRTENGTHFYRCQRHGEMQLPPDGRVLPSAAMSSDRVSILRHRLPLPVAASLAGRARWLRSQLPTIDDELHLPYPPIEIVPICWWSYIGQKKKYVPGHVTRRPIGNDDDVSRFVVQLTAPTVLIYEEELVLGILAHEFLHVVYDTLVMYETVSAGAPGVSIDDTGYTASFASYRHLDRARQVDPAVWLSPRLNGFLDLAERQPNAHGDAALRRIEQEWVQRDLPVDELVIAPYTTQVLLDRAILKRAAQLQRANE